MNKTDKLIWVQPTSRVYPSLSKMVTFGHFYVSFGRLTKLKHFFLPGQFIWCQTGISNWNFGWFPQNCLSPHILINASSHPTTPAGVSSCPLPFIDTHTDDTSQRLHILNTLSTERLPHLSGTTVVQATTFSGLDLPGASSPFPTPLPSNLQAPTFLSNLHPTSTIARRVLLNHRPGPGSAPNPSTALSHP